MRIENTSDENIYIFAGIPVPAKGFIGVDPAMEQQVRDSPLVTDYVKSGALVIHEHPTAPESVKPAVTKPAVPAVAKTGD